MKEIKKNNGVQSALMTQETFQFLSTSLKKLSMLDLILFTLDCSFLLLRMYLCFH